MKKPDNSCAKFNGGAIQAAIYLDYWERRTDNQRNLDEFAFQILKRTVACEFEIVISDLVLAELEKYLALDSIRTI